MTQPIHTFQRRPQINRYSTLKYSICMFEVRSLGEGDIFTFGCRASCGSPAMSGSSPRICWRTPPTPQKSGRSARFSATGPEGFLKESLSSNVGPASYHDQLSACPWARSRFGWPPDGRNGRHGRKPWLPMTAMAGGHGGHGGFKSLQDTIQYMDLFFRD